MNYQTVVGLGGAALVGLNYWDGPQRANVSPLLSGNSAPNAHAAFKQIGAELAFVIVATVLAGTSDSWGVGMLAVLIGLTILWAINRAGKPKTQSAPASTTGPTSVTTAAPATTVGA